MSETWNVDHDHDRLWLQRLNFAALLFDMDGTLIDSRAAVERTWQQWTARHNLDFATVLAAAHGRRTHDTVRMFCPAGVDPVQEADILVAHEETDTEGILPLPGAPEILAQLPAHRWAVVTSASAKLAHNRLAAACLPRPGTLVTAEAVRHGKPDPEGYVLAAERLGVAPHDCLVIEDAPAGIAAARAAGASVLVVTGAQPHPVPTDALTVPNFLHIRLTLEPDGIRVQRR